MSELGGGKPWVAQKFFKFAFHNFKNILMTELGDCTSTVSCPKICCITTPYFLMIPFYLLGDSSYINKAFSEDDGHAAGSTT